MTRLFQQHRSRILFVNMIFVTIMVVVLFKMFVIQIVNHGTYAAQAERQGNMLDVLPAARGQITDRHGKSMTSNIVNYSFAADPQVLKDHDAIAAAMSGAFGRPVAHYLAKLNTPGEFVWLERNAPRARAESLINISQAGFMITPKVHRRYPYGSITRSLLGTTNVDNTGISGIELQYDELLRGEAGSQLIRRDARGRAIPRPDELNRPINAGAEIRLTIDIDYQSIFAEEMAQAGKRLKAKSINGILIDPHTGDILAMAQYQSIDPEDPGPGRLAALRPHSVTDMYEPGSTLKVVTAVAALESGLYSTTDSLDVEGGEFEYYNLTIEDTHPHETVSFSEVLAYSSNIGIIKIAEELGAEELYRYSCNFGLGALTGLSLPGESPGILRHVDKWSKISTGEIAMGQEIGVTSLQLAMLYSSIANGGLLLEPRLVMGAGSGRDMPSESRQQIIRRVASTATMATMRTILKGAVEIGTASTAQIPGFELAGKTGTAQKFIDGKYSDKEFVSTFAAIFPADAPKLVCVVAVDEAVYGYHYGSQAAAPIVRNTFRRILNLDDDLYIPMPEQTKLADVTASASGLLASLLPTATNVPPPIKQGVVPNFEGYSLRAALKLARKSGIEIRVIGSGQVVKQSIRPGKKFSERTTCILTLDEVGLPS